MQSELQLRTDPATAYTPQKLETAVCRKLGIAPERLGGIAVVRRSIDARQRAVMVNVTVRAYVDEPMPAHPNHEPVEYTPVEADSRQCVVVGAGPAGLFAALRLIELGIRPIVLERGKDVDSRRADMAQISRKSTVDPDSNYCFGEGGAGAYSDGKLFTRSKKRGNVSKILNILHQHGAQENILSDAHPHIGSDRLPEVIKAIRKTIIRCGGEVRFSTKVTGLTIDGDTVRGVVTADGQTFDGPVILATGHSARDVYDMLHRSGVRLEAKGIAVGVRLEHPQHLIDCIRYHNPKGRGPYLPAAEYTMLTRVDGRAVYSFCMCPGGVIIPAASAPGEMVVNGMSASARGSRWANSGMVVEVLPEDVPGESPLRMVQYQENIEKAFFEESQGRQNAPAQRMADFVDGRQSESLPPTSYAPGIHPARVDRLLPAEISSRLRRGFEEFGRKNRGFLTNEAIVLGDETRTSSPVRIPRDPETLSHTGVYGLFPCGEGAGYAGGIASAAMDGERCADAVAAYLGR